MPLKHKPSLFSRSGHYAVSRLACPRQPAYQGRLRVGRSPRRQKNYKENHKTLRFITKLMYGWANEPQQRSMAKPFGGYSKLGAIKIYYNFKDSDFSRLYPSNFSQNAKNKLDRPRKMHSLKRRVVLAPVCFIPSHSLSQRGRHKVIKTAIQHTLRI